MERRELPENVARRFVGIDHGKQKELLAEMREKGVMRGAGASRAVTEKKNGKTVSGERNGKRMLNREFIESYLAALEDLRGVGPAAVRANLRFLLGDTAALSGSEQSAYRDAVKRARR